MMVLLIFLLLLILDLLYVSEQLSKQKQAWEYILETEKQLWESRSTV